MPKSKLTLPIADWTKPAEPSGNATLAQVAAICQEIALAKATGSVGYNATFPQLFFFTLVRLLKTDKKSGQKEQTTPVDRWQQPDSHVGLSFAAVTTIVTEVAHHLINWGAAVAGLRQRDAKEWELLRIQMEGVLQGIACPQAVKDDALQDSLLKLFHMLDKLPAAQHIEAAPDVLRFLTEQQAIVGGIYDFASPFYAYVHVIARNTLIYALRRNNHEPIYSVAWDELTSEPATADAYGFDAEEKAQAKAAQLLQLRIDLANLFALIAAAMQPQRKRRLVVWHTLAARSQYWLALALTGLPPPVPFPPTPQVSDTDIAKELKMTENGVRVHRKQAKSQIELLDAACGELLATLMDLDQSNDLQWWPKNE